MEPSVLPLCGLLSDRCFAIMTHIAVAIPAKEALSWLKNAVLCARIFSL